MLSRFHLTTKDAPTPALVSTCQRVASGTQRRAGAGSLKSRSLKKVPPALTAPLYICGPKGGIKRRSANGKYYAVKAGQVDPTIWTKFNLARCNSIPGKSKPGKSKLGNSQTGNTTTHAKDHTPAKKTPWRVSAILRKHFKVLTPEQPKAPTHTSATPTPKAVSVKKSLSVGEVAQPASSKKPSNKPSKKSSKKSSKIPVATALIERRKRTQYGKVLTYYTVRDALTVLPESYWNQVAAYTKTLKEKKVKVHDRFDDKMRDTTIFGLISEYQSNSDPINRPLRKIGELPPEHLRKKWIQQNNINTPEYERLTHNLETSELIQRALLEAPPIPTPIVLFRGLKGIDGENFVKQFEVGKVNAIQGFQSFTHELSIAHSFGTSAGVVVVAHVPAGARAYPMVRSLTGKKEGEFLFPHGTAWKLLEVLPVDSVLEHKTGPFPTRVQAHAYQHGPDKGKPFNYIIRVLLVTPNMHQAKDDKDPASVGVSLLKFQHQLADGPTDTPNRRLLKPRSIKEPWEKDSRPKKKLNIESHRRSVGANRGRHADLGTLFSRVPVHLRHLM